MKFRPLFFLPRPALLWAYRQAMSERLLDTPFGWLFTSWDSHGVWFSYKGDEVLWTWPWTRAGKAPFISLGFSGNGDFGDARYWTLAELDKDWDGYFDAERQMAERDEQDARFQEACQPMVDQLMADIECRTVEMCVNGMASREYTAAEEISVGDLVQALEDGRIKRASS